MASLHEHVVAYALLSQYVQLIGVDPPEVRPAVFPSENKREMLDFVKRFFHQTERQINELRYNDEIAIKSRIFAERLANKYKSVFSYEFTEGNLKEIQARINDLRQMISSSGYLEENFKRRLLKRLEHLQAEIHKRMSDLDRFWGLIGDAGVALHRFGEDAKALFDRVRELLDVVWQTQARAEELPSRTPLPQLERKKTDDPAGQS